MKKNRRLLHLIKSLDLGGIEKTTIQYSKELINNFDLVGIYAQKGFYDKADYLNSNIERFSPPLQISNYLFLFVNFFHLFYTIKQNKITHIHFHHRIFIPYIFLLKLFLPHLHYYYTHHSCFNDKLNNWIIADKMIALNEATKKDLPQKFHAKVITIPHGIPFQNIHLKTTPPRTIGFVGRYVQLKGINYLLDEFKMIKSLIPDAQLYFYGKGPEENKMKNFVKEHLLTDSIYFSNPQIELSNIYKNIDLLVLPSFKTEGFGLVILEAFSFGVPVVVKDLPIYNGLVENKYNGIVTNEEFSKSIVELFYNATLFNKMRENAKNSLLEKYKLQNTISNYRKFYK